MLFAQSLGEYGGLTNGGGSQMSASLGDIASTIEESLRNPTPKTWLAIAAFFFVLWFIFIRRRR